MLEYIHGNSNLEITLILAWNEFSLEISTHWSLCSFIKMIKWRSWLIAVLFITRSCSTRPIQSIAYPPQPLIKVKTVKNAIWKEKSLLFLPIFYTDFFPKFRVSREQWLKIANEFPTWGTVSRQRKIPFTSDNNLTDLSEHFLEYPNFLEANDS